MGGVIMKTKTIRHILVCEMPYRLLHSLIRKHCLTEFLNNVIERLTITEEIQSLSEYRAKHIIDTLINDWKKSHGYLPDILANSEMSFIWSDTIEGRYYWMDIYYDF